MINLKRLDPEYNRINNILFNIFFSNTLLLLKIYVNPTSLKKTLITSRTCVKKSVKKC